MSTTAVPDNNPRNGFMVVTQVVPPDAAGQNVVVPGPGVATSSIPNVGAYTVGVPTAEFPNVGVHNVGVRNVGVRNVGVRNVGVRNVGVPFVTPVSNINTGPAPNPPQKFLKSLLAFLGTIQIMIGVVTILLGILLTVGTAPFSVSTGIAYWGSIFYITTGSMTIRAGNKRNSCLVNGALRMNVCSALVSGIGVIFLLFDFVLDLGYDPCYSYPTDSYTCQLYLQLLDKTYGISGVLLTLFLLQLIISICISAFVCKATCCNVPVVSVVTVGPHHPACCSRINQTHSGQQDVFHIANPAVNVNNPPTGNPPAYSLS